MNITNSNKFQKSIIVILVISFLLITTCTNEKTMTGNNQNPALEKPTDSNDFFSDPTENDPWPEFTNRYGVNFNDFANFYCLMIILMFPSETTDKWLEQLSDTPNPNTLDQSYDFRDNYLQKSPKGEMYIASYYFLSKYGIENNLVMKHSLEHLSLMNLGLEVSQELQHGTNDDLVLINKSTYDDCKNILKVYRNSKNHSEIDFVLDSLETDLEKYYNKPKAVIAADFQ